MALAHAQNVRQSTSAHNLGHEKSEEEPHKPAPEPPRLFTRHPQALAAVALLKLPASWRFVLSLLLIYADDDGISWAKPRQIAIVVPRSAVRPQYSLAQVLRALRGLRAAGLITWQYIRPFGRVGRTKSNPSGFFSSSGQRVWRVELARLAPEEADRHRRRREHREAEEIRGGGPPTKRVAATAGKVSDYVGTKSGGSIISDHSGSIIRGPSSDLPIPFGDLLKLDPAAHAAPHRPTAGQVASETPTTAPAAPGPHRPTAGQVASETPATARAPRPSRHGQTPTETEKRGRGKEQKPGRTPAGAMALPDALAALLRIGAMAAERNHRRSEAEAEGSHGDETENRAPKADSDAGIDGSDTTAGPGIEYG